MVPVPLIACNPAPLQLLLPRTPGTGREGGSEALRMKEKGMNREDETPVL